jgi:cytoskeletal protein CcmA (bactofilin family)
MLKISNKKIKAVPVSVIQKEVVIAGNISSESALEIAGKVEGDVKCVSLILQEGASITGNIAAEKAEIHGEVKGEIKARSVICGKTAKITGDITHQSIHIENGAFVDGNCRKFISEETPKLHLVEDTKPE